MLPLLKFYYHEDVRLAAAFSMPEFVKCCLKHAEANGGDLAVTSQLTNVVYTNLVQCIPDEPQVDVQMAMLEALQETVEAGAKVLQPEQVRLATCSCCFPVVTLSTWCSTLQLAASIRRRFSWPVCLGSGRRSRSSRRRSSESTFWSQWISGASCTCTFFSNVF